MFSLGYFGHGENKILQKGGTRKGRGNSSIAKLRDVTTKTYNLHPTRIAAQLQLSLDKKNLLVKLIDSRWVGTILRI